MAADQKCSGQPVTSPKLKSSSLKMLGKIKPGLSVDAVTEVPVELLKLTNTAGISFEISAAFSNLQKQQENASKAHEYTRHEIDGVNACFDQYWNFAYCPAWWRNAQCFVLLSPQVLIYLPTPGRRKVRQKFACTIVNKWRNRSWNTVFQDSPSFSK